MADIEQIIEPEIAHGDIIGATDGYDTIVGKVVGIYPLAVADFDGVTSPINLDEFAIELLLPAAKAWAKKTGNPTKRLKVLRFCATHGRQGTTMDHFIAYAESRRKDEDPDFIQPETIDSSQFSNVTADLIRNGAVMYVGTRKTSARNDSGEVFVCVSFLNDQERYFAQYFHDRNKTFGTGRCNYSIPHPAPFDMGYDPYYPMPPGVFPTQLVPSFLMGAKGDDSNAF